MATSLAQRNATGTPKFNHSRRVVRTVAVDTGTGPGGYAPAYGCICPILGLGNGHALAVWTRDTAGGAGGSVWQSRTADSGQTWEAATQIVAGPLQVSCGVMCHTSGEIILMIQDSLHAVNYSRVMRNATNGDPAAWSAEVEINPAFTAWSVANYAPVQLVSGNLFLGFYGADSNDPLSPQYLRFMASSDVGITWAEIGTPIFSPDTTRFLSEVCPVLLDNGSMRLMIRSDPAVGDDIFTMWSCVDPTGLGTSFTQPALVNDAGGAQPSIIQTPDGDVMVMTRETDFPVGKSSAWQSFDHGATWTQRYQQFMAYQMEYGMWANIGPAGADNSVCSLVGTLQTDGSLVFNGWSKLGG